MTHAPHEDSAGTSSAIADAQPAGAAALIPAPQVARLLRWSLSCFVVVTMAALTGVTHPLDRALRLDAWLSNDLLDETLKLVERPGQRVVVLPLLFAVTAYLGWRLRSWRPVVATAVAVSLVNVSVGLLKWWSDRATPRLGGPGFFDEPGYRLLGAYPSGHATNVGMWAVLAWFLSLHAQPTLRYWVRRLSVAWVLVIVLCSWARSTHWITDLVAGVALGAACSCAGVLISRWERPTKASPPDRGDGSPASAQLT